MKCTIIRDLLPLYCDGLTSADSSSEVEEHLAGCEECRKVYEQMSTKESVINVPDRDIKPLEKVKKRNKGKILLTVLATVAVLCGVFMFVFVGVIPISSSKVHYTVIAEEYDLHEVSVDADNVKDADAEIASGNATETTIKSKGLNLKFKCDCKCMREKNKFQPIYSDNDAMTIHDELWFYPEIKLPFDNRGKHANEYSHGYSNVHMGDTLTIHCLDRDIEIDLWQLYLENVEE